MRLLPYHFLMLHGAVVQNSLCVFLADTSKTTKSRPGNSRSKSSPPAGGKWGEDFKKYNAFTTLQAFEALNNRSNFVKSL
jgi:hypothetical protein